MTTVDPREDQRRAVPRTDVLLADPRLADATARLGRERVKAAVVAAQQAVREGALGPTDVVGAALDALPATATTLRPVLNATGVLLHTNLGRAPLSDAARTALAVAAGTCDVELDLATGERGPRGAGVLDALLRAVPGAGAAHVVNNGAAALALTAMALAGPDGRSADAAGREMVIARGELVEIGDGFRIPELLAATGARLREVGTTNRVTRADYAAAIGEQTALVLKVHPSNFVVRGFTSACDVDELVGLGVPVVADIGSGLLAPHPLLPDEPDAATALAKGATVVTASGDKLLGGPQAGLVLGAPGMGADAVARIRRHPLARAMRVDKLTLAALEATLRGPCPPVHRFLDADPADLRRRAERLAAALADLGAEVVDTQARVGGGGAPEVALPSAAVALPERYAAALRAGEPAVLGRLEHGRCLVDLRAIEQGHDADIAAAVRACTS